MNEYIVTCRSYEDLEDLYDDMETPGGSLYIPDRAVELVHRRAISRNTHYMLTEEEAVEIRNDERVIACERLASERGLIPDYLWTQTADFNKTTGTFAGDDKNWGLYRTTEVATVSNWGSDNTAEITNRTIACSGSGKNVDVVIVDSHVNPNHPEFAVNSDGTGGSRVIQFNWFSYSTTLGYTTGASYPYSTQGGGSPYNSNHGTHVAGTACGNTQGWARDANIYNMAFSDSLSGVTDWDEKFWDYLRHFHQNKAINATTGRRNPTITNHSWGYSYAQVTISLQSVNSVTYRGTTTSLSGTDAARKTVLEANGVPVPKNTYLFKVPARVAAVDADLQDAINDGVIVISASGNSYWNIDVSTGVDYDNQYNSVYHSRGMTPAAADNVICVGNIGSLEGEYKSEYSNWGTRVDIWAPGTDIISAVYDSSSASTEGNFAYTPIIADSRNSSYHLASISGTSMASPQVAGVVACLAEQEPNLTQAEALQFLKENSVAEVGTTGTENTSPYHTLGASSNNRYMTFPMKRPLTGTLSPAVRHKNRNSDTDGVKFPRVRNNRVFK